MCENVKETKSLPQKSADPSLDSEWESWKTTFEKKYNTSDEETFRRALWEKNKEMIVTHNLEYEKGLHSYSLGINQFSDMEPDEVCCGKANKGKCHKDPCPR